MAPALKAKSPRDIPARKSIYFFWMHNPAQRRQAESKSQKLFFGWIRSRNGCLRLPRLSVRGRLRNENRELRSAHAGGDARGIERRRTGCGSQPLRRTEPPKRHSSSPGQRRGHPCVRLLRDLSGRQRARLLWQYGYGIARQTGSHLRLTSKIRGSEHHITIPARYQLWFTGTNLSTRSPPTSPI